MPVRDGASVQGLVVSTGPPTAVLLGHEMESGQPLALGTSGYTVLQHSIELGLGHGQAVRIKAAWVVGYWWAGRCTYVMCGAVLHLAMAPCRFCQLRKFLQEAVRGHASHDDFNTRDGWWCDEAWRGQWCDPIEQVVVPAVDKESIVWEQIHTDDWKLHIRYHETPREVTAQSQVQAPWGPSICGDGDPIGSIQGIVRALCVPWQELTWEDAQVGPHVHYIPLFWDAFRNEEAAGAGGAD